MQALHKVGNIISKVTIFVGWISFVLVTIMMLLNTIDVILTKFFNTPVVGSYELTQRMLMCAVFTSFAYAQTKKKHINMTLVIKVFPRPVRFGVFTLLSIASCVAAGALAWAAVVQGNVALAANYTTEVLYIPLYPFYYVEALSMAVFTIALLYDTVLSAIAIVNEDVAAEVQKDWD